MLAVTARKLDLEPGDFGKIEPALGLLCAERAKANPKIAFPVTRGPFRHDLHRARMGIASEQLALRTAQHLDAFGRHEVHAGALRAGIIDAVEIERNRQIL